VRESNGVNDTRKDSEGVDKTQMEGLPVGGMEAGAVAEAGSKQWAGKEETDQFHLAWTERDLPAGVKAEITI